MSGRTPPPRRWACPRITTRRKCWIAKSPTWFPSPTGGYEYSSDHYEPTMQALRAGCHVLGEKPISNDLRHAQEMVDLAEKMGVCYGIDMNHRFTARGPRGQKMAG